MRLRSPTLSTRTHLTRFLHNKPQEVPFGLKVDVCDCLLINDNTILSHGGKKGFCETVHGKSSGSRL